MMKDQRRRFWILAGFTCLALGLSWIVFTSGEGASRLRMASVPVLPVDGRFVTATQQGTFMYLYFQTEKGVRIFQLDVGQIQGLGDEVEVRTIMDVTTAPAEALQRQPRGGTRRSVY